MLCYRYTFIHTFIQPTIVSVERHFKLVLKFPTRSFADVIVFVGSPVLVVGGEGLTGALLYHWP
jgi:hypothetical protein